MYSSVVAQYTLQENTGRFTKYLKGFQNKLGGISLAPNVFVLWNGEAITSSLITMPMGVFLETRNGKPRGKNQSNTGKEICNDCCTGKYATTKQFTANLLNHSLGMEEKKYATFDKEHVAAAISVKLKKVQRSCFDEKNSSQKDIPLQEIFKDVIRKCDIKTGDVRETIWENPDERVYKKSFGQYLVHYPT